MAYIDDKKVDLGKKEKKPFVGEYDDHADVIAMLKKAQGSDHDNREFAREAFLFVNKRDGQWEPFWWNANSGKPRYTFDVVSKLIKRAVNEVKQASFDIRVSPAGGDATKDVAATYDGMIRNIENMSKAKQVYGGIAKGAITSGFDAFRIEQKFVDEDSFDQDLAISKINNALDRVWFDPSAELQDKSDSRYAFVLHPMSAEEYDNRWPKGSAMSVADDREGEAYYDKRETVVVGEMLYCKLVKKVLVVMSNGQTHEVNDEFKTIVDDLSAAGVTEVRRRERYTKEWCSRFFDNDDWLEASNKTVFGKCPVIPIYCNYDIFENKTIYFGLVEKELDSQRVLNYSLSREIEEGALAPRAKYWMTTTQAAGHEASLETLNTNSDPVQFYNPDPEAMGVPQQNGGAVINSGLRNISASMLQMINDVGSQYDASNGANPNAQSGVAINSLQNRSDATNYDFTESMEIAITAAAAVLVDAIPKVYDTPRSVRVLYEDETYEMEDLHQTIIDQATGNVVVVNDLSVGKYDVVCTAGPAFKNRQDETMAAILAYAEVDPSIIQLGGDLLLNNIPTPAAKQLSERKRARMIAEGMIPEEQLTDDEKQKQQQQNQAQGQQQDAAMALAQAEMLKGQADMVNAETNKIKAQNDQMKLQLEMMKLQQVSQASQANTQVDSFNAETKRGELEVKASEAGVKIQKEKVLTTGAQIDNEAKMKDLMRPNIDMNIGYIGGND